MTLDSSIVVNDLAVLFWEYLDYMMRCCGQIVPISCGQMHTDPNTVAACLAYDDAACLVCSCVAVTFVLASSCAVLSVVQKPGCTEILDWNFAGLAI